MVIVYITIICYALIFIALVRMMKRYFRAVNPDRNGRNLFRNRSCLEYEFAYDFAYFSLFMTAASNMQMSGYLTPHI